MEKTSERAVAYHRESKQKQYNNQSSRTVARALEKMLRGGVVRFSLAALNPLSTSQKRPTFRFFQN